MCLVNKVEIYWAKIGLVDCKWPNLNAPGSYTAWCHSLLGSTGWCPFLCMQGKAAHGLSNLFDKTWFHGLQMVQFECPRFIHSWSHSLLGSTGCPFLCMQGKRNATCGLLIKWKSIWKIGFVDCKWSNLNAPVCFKNRFNGLQRVLFECPRVILLIHLLVSFIHFWGSLGGADSALFSAYDLLRK